MVTIPEKSSATRLLVEQQTHPPIARQEPPKPQRITGIERIAIAERGIQVEAEPAPAPADQPEATAPEVTERADAASKPKTTMPRIAGGYKLPPNSLLHRPDEQQAIAADELKLLLQVLTAEYV